MLKELTKAELINTFNKNLPKELGNFLRESDEIENRIYKQGFIDGIKMALKIIIFN